MAKNELHLAIDPVHPGRILLDEMDANGYSVEVFAYFLKVDREALKDVLAGREPMTRELAKKISGHLSTTVKFWMNLQASYERSIQANDHLRDATKKVEAEIDG